MNLILILVWILITWPIAAWLLLRKRAYSMHVRGKITKLDSRIRCKQLKPCTIHYTYKIGSVEHKRTETIKPSPVFDRICIGPCLKATTKGLRAESANNKLTENAGISVYVNPKNHRDARLYHNNDDYRLTGFLLAVSAVAFALGMPFVKINSPRFRGGLGTMSRKNFNQTGV